MKYEYLKGSEKDFEGAPEWATECVWNDKGSESFCYWLNPKTKTIFNPNWHSKPDCWNEEYGWRNYIKAERRPITEPVVNQQLTTEWDGEGLPPAGVECQVKTSIVQPYEWAKCEIVFSDEMSGVAFVYEDKSLDSLSARAARSFFRPIRSPEDVARDEAKGIIAELCRSSASNGHSADLIYDAIAAGKIPGVTLSGK